nr:RNA-directed DNA polymerase, eukaryota, reverse transcriptase zinc-binding domain protein [Tanacetum cinerariifolium]
MRGNVNFEIKNQFIRELREDAFSRNKNDDAYEHVERILDIVSLFNIPGVTHDAVMLLVFPITLTGAAKRRVSNDSSTRIVAITNKLDNLGRDMKKLKENVHAIQIGCETCEGAHLNKECPLHEEVKIVEEVKYEEFKRPFLSNKENGARYRNLETQIEQLGKYYKAKATNEVPHPSVGQCKAISANDEAPTDEASSKRTTGVQEVSFVSDDNMQDMTKMAPVGIVKNILIKIDKFIFPYDFVIIDMPGHLSEMTIFGRSFLATIHAQIDVFHGEISLGIGEGWGPGVERKEMSKTLDSGISNDPYSRSLEEYTTVFDNEIEQLENKYELRIRNKGYILDDLWEKCERFHGGTSNPWHDKGHEEEERWKSGLDNKCYDPPLACVETFEVKRYSFEVSASQEIDNPTRLVDK